MQVTLQYSIFDENVRALRILEMVRKAMRDHPMPSVRIGCILDDESGDTDQSSDAYA